MLEVDKDEENKNLCIVDKEINRIKKAIRQRKHKNSKYRELYLRLSELKNSKTNIRNKIDALKQIISHNDEVKDEVKLKIKQLKRKIKIFPKENPFDFTEYVERKQDENEIDLGLFLELAERNKIVYNQVPVNALIKDMEKLRKGFLTNGFLSLGDDGEIDANRIFKDSKELAEFIDEILDKDDDHTSIYYTGNIYR